MSSPRRAPYTQAEAAQASAWLAWLQVHRPDFMAYLARACRQVMPNTYRRLSKPELQAELLSRAFDGLLGWARHGRAEEAEKNLLSYVANSIRNGFKDEGRTVTGRARHWPTLARSARLVDSMTPSAHAQGQEELARFFAAVRRLPEAQQQVVTLRFIANLRLAEVGKVIGISERSAAKRLQNALAKLRMQMGPDYSRSSAGKPRPRARRSRAK